MNLKLLLLVVLLAPGLLRADEEEAADVTLRVRTVKALGAAQGREVAQVVDSRLGDVSSKFSSLPYRSFRLLASREVPVLPRRKATIRLDEGQLLNVRLLYANDEKVGMWVRWTDKDGTELLDTRMHFRCEEAMVTGTNSTADSATILTLGIGRVHPAAASAGAGE